MTQFAEEILPPEGANPAPPPEQGTQKPEQMTTAQAKAACCMRLKNVFSNKLMEERLLKMAGGDASRVAKNLTAFLSLIMEHDGGSRDPEKKKYYHQCTIQSLTSCFLESMNMQLPFDSRKLVSIIIYDWGATLDISYKGFVNALNRHFKDAFVECKLVFEDDEFIASIDGRAAAYKFKPADPFAVVTPDFKGIKGGYCFFSYTDTDGKYTSRLVFLSRAQILKNKSRAQQTYVWNADPKAMGEKTCIREGARLPFAAIDLDVDIEEVDNRHYRLEAPAGGDKLKLLMQAQEEAVHGKSEPKETIKPRGDGAQPQGGAELKNNVVASPTPMEDASTPKDEGGAKAKASTTLDAIATSSSTIIDQQPQSISDEDFDDDAAAYAGRDE